MPIDSPFVSRSALLDDNALAFVQRGHGAVGAGGDGKGVRVIEMASGGINAVIRLLAGVVQPVNGAKRVDGNQNVANVRLPRH